MVIVLFGQYGTKWLLGSRLFFRTVTSCYLGPMDSLKYFEISVPRHIRFAESRKK